MGSRGQAMKIKITHEAEERELAETVFRTVRQLLPRSRRHEAQQDGHRVLYLTAKRSEREAREKPIEPRANPEKVFNEQRANKEK